jgi:hypothetical protein
MSIPHHNPFRELDWRYRRAQALITQEKCPSRTRDDRRTWQAWRFFRGLAQCDDGGRHERIRRRHSDLAAAVELQQSVDALQRWEVEGCILAGESFAAIAARTGLTVAALEAYAGLFFDVVDSLHASYWVVLQVIRYTPSRIITEDDAATWIRYFAFFGGIHLLDAMFGFFGNAEPIPDDVTQVAPDRRPRVALHMRIRAAVAARCLSVGDPRVAEFTHMAERLEALCHNPASQASVPGLDLLQEVDGQYENIEKNKILEDQERRAG